MNKSEIIRRFPLSAISLEALNPQSPGASNRRSDDPSRAATLKTVIGRQAARAVAVSLLLLAVLCLGFPALCQAEPEVLLPSHDVSDSLDRRGAAPEAPEGGCGADCFCCCLRIRPQAIVHGVEAPTGVSAAVVADAPTKPLLRTIALFHPPRP